MWPSQETQDSENGKPSASGGKKLKVMLSVMVLLCVGALVTVGILAVMLGDKNRENREMNEEMQLLKWPKPSDTGMERFVKAAVATDTGVCSDAARQILLRGGNAADAAVAALACVGVTNPQSAGIGGGFLMTLFDAKTQTCYSVDAREVAPKASTPLMFKGIPHSSPNGSFFGYRAVAVPGELRGYSDVFQRFGSGKVEWRELFQRSIQLARDGFPVSGYLEHAMDERVKLINGDDHFRDYWTNPKTKKFWREGDILKNTELAKLLEKISGKVEDVDRFYEGDIARQIEAEMKKNGGLLTVDDLKSYQTLIPPKALESRVLGDGRVMCGPPPPSSFVVTQIIVGLMARFYPTTGKPPSFADTHSPLYYHRLIEAEKFAYARRQRLGDGRFLKEMDDYVGKMLSSAFISELQDKLQNHTQPTEYYMDARVSQKSDHGTVQISVLDAEGNAVSATGTVNTYFGAIRMSPTLGIIWNNEMDDFSTPGLRNRFGFDPSPENFIVAGKRPQSSMSPIIVYDDDTKKVKMVAGAAGGSYIISATAQALIRTLLFNETIKEAVDSPRFHHQFGPFEIEYENGAPKELIETLEKEFGHVNFTAVDTQWSDFQGLLVNADGSITTAHDYRRRTYPHPSGY